MRKHDVILNAGNSKVRSVSHCRQRNDGHMQQCIGYLNVLINPIEKNLDRQTYTHTLIEILRTAK